MIFHAEFVRGIIIEFCKTRLRQHKSVLEGLFDLIASHLHFFAYSNASYEPCRLNLHLIVYLVQIGPRKDALHGWNKN